MAETHPLPTHIVRIKKLKSLLAIVENSVKGGDNYLFRNLYADIDGKEVDILEDGAISCAAFVSTILLMPELIKMPHATVSGTEKDMLENGWYEIKAPKPGAVIVWEKVLFEDQKEHRHLGFCVNNDEAISNSAKEGFPRRHHVTYNGQRKIEKILWHPELDKD
jgi:hypothetical protein